MFYALVLLATSASQRKTKYTALVVIAGMIVLLLCGPRKEPSATAKHLLPTHINEKIFSEPDQDDSHLYIAEIGLVCCLVIVIAILGTFEMPLVVALILLLVSVVCLAGLLVSLSEKLSLEMLSSAISLATALCILPVMTLLPACSEKFSWNYPCATILGLILFVSYLLKENQLVFKFLLSFMSVCSLLLYPNSAYSWCLILSVCISNINKSIYWLQTIAIMVGCASSRLIRTNAVHYAITDTLKPGTLHLETIEFLQHILIDEPDYRVNNIKVMNLINLGNQWNLDWTRLASIISLISVLIISMYQHCYHNYYLSK